MPARERLAELMFGGAFAVAVVCLWWIQPPHAFDLLPAAACVLSVASATRVRFDTLLGFTVPTQLGFVPLLFSMPVAIVPLAVVVALVLGRLPEVLAGSRRPGKLWLEVGNSWFPLLALFAVFARERRERLEALLGAQQRLPRNCARARGRRRSGRRLHRRAQQERRRTRAHARRVARTRRRATAQPGVRSASARRWQDRDPQGDHQQARQARSDRVAGHQDPHDRRPEGARPGRRVHAPGRRDRPLTSRAMGRHRLPRRARRRGDPARSRIIGCCDAWNAMRTDRIYRQALPYEAALAELTTNAGRQFDPHIVTALLTIIQSATAHDADPAAAPNRTPQPNPEPATG